MKSTIGLVMVLLVALVACPAMADDGNVSQATLGALGLGSMQVMSDQEGLAIRGMSSSAVSSGGSLIVGQLQYIDNFGVNFFTASDAALSRGTAQNAGLQNLSAASHIQATGIVGALNVNNPAGVYIGSFAGLAGGLPGAASGQ